MTMKNLRGYFQENGQQSFLSNAIGREILKSVKF
jgi:hypothetical protein